MIEPLTYEEAFRAFTLQTSTLFVHPRGILTLFHGTHMAGQAIFSELQFLLLIALLENMDNEYCSYEQLLAVYNNSTCEEAYTQVNHAYEQGTIYECLRPMRKILYSCRSILKPLGLTIIHLNDLGYMLMMQPAQSSKRSIQPRPSRHLQLVTAS